jgi:hypothetical protein
MRSKCPQPKRVETNRETSLLPTLWAMLSPGHSCMRDPVRRVNSPQPDSFSEGYYAGV